MVLLRKLQKKNQNLSWQVERLQRRQRFRKHLGHEVTLLIIYRQDQDIENGVQRSTFNAHVKLVHRVRQFQLTPLPLGSKDYIIEIISLCVQYFLSS